MQPKQQRLLGYPVAAAIVAGLCWAGYGYEAEADFMTLVSSASIHAELAASIPADTPKVDGRQLRAQLLTDAYAFVARAERVQPGSSATQQVRAYLAMQDGDNARAAELYRECRTMDGCTSDQLGRLVMHEAKALSNDGRVAEALQLLVEHQSMRRDDDVVAWSSLRARLLHRAGDVDGARAEARRLAERTDQDADGYETAALLLEGIGDLEAAESAYRRVGLGEDLQNYVFARLKLRAGDTDRATSLLGQSVRTGDPGVLRQLRRDEDLWVTEIGTEVFRRFTTPGGEPAAPSAGR